MSEPIDLGTIRARCDAASASHLLKVADWYEDDVPALLDALEAAQAEVERLRAENEALGHEVMAHQTTSDYERGHEHGTAAGMAARNVVPRSALVQVGWRNPDTGDVFALTPAHRRNPPSRGQPVYVIRTDSEGAK